MIKWKKKRGIKIADKLRYLDQNKATVSTSVVNALNKPNPQEATDKLNAPQVKLVPFLGPLIMTKVAEKMLVRNISNPDIAR